MPKVIELMKSVGFGTKIVCAHFINLLVVQLGKDMQPYAGRYQNEEILKVFCKFCRQFDFSF